MGTMPLIPVHKEVRDEIENMDRCAGFWALILVGVVLANGIIELPRWVFGGGAADSNAGGITLNATLGQPVVGPVTSEGVTLGQGFWHGSSTPEGGKIYLSLVHK